MSRLHDSNPPQRNIPPEFQQIHRQAIPQFPSSNPPKVQEEPVTLFYPKAGRLPCFKNFFRNLFYLQFSLITVLTAVLAVRGLLSHHHHNLRLPKLLFPLLSSTALAALVAFSCQFFTLLHPSRTLKVAFWLSPLLTCAAGILLVSVGSAASLAIASLALVSAILMSLYSCWVSPRFDYAGQVLSVSISSPPPRTATIVFLTIIGGALYSGLIAAGIGGATAATTWGGLDKVFILVIVLSYTWTMNVVKNVVGVVISRVKYMKFACGMELETGLAFRDVRKHTMGSVCVGSVLVPVLGLVCGSARAMSSASGETDEFMFSCVNCYSRVASKLVTYGNRWGFVHVGVYNKRFVQASIDTWEMFRRAGLEPLIDSDLTSSFCFLCGVAGGGVCALAGGTWSIVVHNGYATVVSIYAFLIGYFMCRVAMAWPQACVSAYHVAYAENPESARFDATIPVRIQELQRSRAQNSHTVHDSTEFE
ncbi:hypothetical protein RHGRI_006722 [Rhododendron griersonianum]|uniref:Choline transporter-like protein n=1 Tax=Rhododendron griersonianum TaxID=479676 RepID=A0AAV6KVB8_9ERIC|nr:hypothetical protein RHGRI_006722 [Rhododendron griersonianum]